MAGAQSDHRAADLPQPRAAGRLLTRVGALTLASLALADCGWWPGVESSYLIDRTRILATRVEVVEIGSAWPARIGFDPNDAPITEAMPGDRVRLTGMIVGADGRALPSGEFDAMWIQCAGYSCVPESELPRCSDIGWPTDVTCEIGRGGELEFEVPPVSPDTLRWGSISTLAIFALEPDLDPETCFELLREPRPELDGCGVVRGEIQIGPRWGLMAELTQAGVEVDFPVTEIPYLALDQPANRLAMPIRPDWFDADSGAMILGEPLRVHAGQHVSSQGPIWRRADFQHYVFAREVVEDEVYVFLPDAEDRTTEWYSSVGLTLLDVGDVIEFRVEEDAEPGPASVVLLFGDVRFESGSRWAYDFRVFEFEVVP